MKNVSENLNFRRVFAILSNKKEGCAVFSLHLDQQATYTLMALTPLLIQVGALAFAIWADAYFKPKQKRVFPQMPTRKKNSPTQSPKQRLPSSPEWTMT